MRKRKSYLRRNPFEGQPFAGRLIEMLDSPAYRVLSLSAHRLLARIEIELHHHGGYDNGKLPVTYKQFEEYGIDRLSIAAAIRECEALGFLEVTEPGRGGNREHRAVSLYRLTYMPVGRARPTHEWRRLQTIEEAEIARRAARRALASKTFPAPGKQRRTRPWKTGVTTPVSTPGKQGWSRPWKTGVPLNSGVDVSCVEARRAPPLPARAHDGRQPVSSEGPTMPDNGKHTRESLMTCVENVIDEQLHGLDRRRVSARKRLHAALEDGKVKDEDGEPWFFTDAAPCPAKNGALLRFPNAPSGA
jgi:hypothetical protein